MISKNEKLIYIHVPKTGGFSIREIVRVNYGGIYNKDAYPSFTQDRHEYPLGGRYTHMTLREHELNNKDIRNFRVFALVRNPWDRAVSEYEWRKVRSKSHSDRPDFSSFDDFIYHLQHGWEYQDDDIRHVFSQSAFLKNRNNRIANVSIGQFENFEEDIRKIFRSFGLSDFENMVKINSSNRKKKYKDYYNTKSRDIISKLYQEDIDNFKYCF